MNERHPTVGLDDVVHQRTRLGVLALLRTGVALEFGAIRDALAVTDGNLNRHLKVLSDAGYVESRRVTGSGRPRTWLTITDSGSDALNAEIAVLEALVAGGQADARA